MDTRVPLSPYLLLLPAQPTAATVITVSQTHQLSVFLFLTGLISSSALNRESWELFADSESEREENQFTSYQDLVRGWEEEGSLI